jgi:D-alanine-D-alanine ligase-like ATP-grasp enzyme
MPKAAKQCEECGGDAIAHEFTYWSLLIDELIAPIIAPPPLLHFLSRMTYGVERAVTPAMFKFFVATGIAKKVTEPDDDTMLLALMIWNEAKARGIDMYEVRMFGLARNLFVATLPSGRTIAFEGIPEPVGGNAKVWWMDNKAILKQKFSKLGLPIASGGSTFTKKGARTIYDKLVPPVIVKPYAGSASRHTILHIDTPKELERAFKIATQVAPFAVIEEELVGPVYRATVVDGKLSATLRRDPPTVVGDGVRSVRDLVAEANTHPARSGPYFHPIKLDEAAEKELAWQGHTFDSVPEKGARVLLHQKVNWSVGGTTADVSDEVHPDNAVLFEETARALNTPITGIDFIIGDIAKSWKEQDRCGILECNSMPFFDNHHLPFEGKPRNVASDIWDMALKGT